MTLICISATQPQALERFNILNMLREMKRLNKCLQTTVLLSQNVIHMKIFTAESKKNYWKYFENTGLLFLSIFLPDTSQELKR